MTVDSDVEVTKLGERVSDFLALDAQLHHSQEALTRVIAKLKAVLVKLIQKRRADATRPATQQSRAGSRGRPSRLPSRMSDFSGHSATREIHLKIHNDADAFVNSTNLSGQAICTPAPFLSVTKPRPFTANTRSTLENGADGWVPPSILNRISLKVHDSWRQRPATCQPSGGMAGPKSDSVRRARSVSHDSSDTINNEIDVDYLKLKVHEIKTAEALALRKSNNYSPKRLLSEYSSYGIRVNRNWKPIKPNPTHDAARELVSLIDRIDQQLSSNEALATLKELGIDYQPRSAFGKKNMMASDFSMALAPNGLRLNDGPPPSPNKEEVTGRTFASGTT